MDQKQSPIDNDKIIPEIPYKLMALKVLVALVRGSEERYIVIS